MKPITFALKRQASPDGFGSRLAARSNVSAAELYARTPFSPEALARLGQACVAIFGLGSGGSKLALDLAKAGVGRFRLVDPARLEARHVSRHQASLKDVGRWKVEAVAEILLGHNPLATVDCYPLDPFDAECEVEPESLLQGADLAIGATDRTSAQLHLNALAWRLGVPAVFGGCYEAARGGEVLFTLPGEKTPCLACLRAGLPPPEREGPFDYSAALGPEDFRGEPGLGAAVDLVTDVETQIALGLLLRGSDSALQQLVSPQRNFLLVGGALAAGFYRFKRPFHVFWQPLVGPRPGCPVCAGAALAG